MSSAATPGRPARSHTATGLTVLAVVLTIGLYALAGLGKNGRLPVNLALYGTLYAAGLVGGHLLIRRLAPTADPVLFPAAAVLVGIGFVTIFRLDGELAAEQAAWLVIGFVAFAATLIFVRDYRQLDAFTYTLGLAGIALLLLPIVPGLGQEINGARLWIRLGSLQFQPAELGKVLIVVFLASYLNRNKELLQVATAKIGPIHLPQPKHLGPVFLAWGLSLAVLFLEKDLGASLLYFAIFVVMLWIATGRGSYLVLGAILFVFGAFIAFQTFGHVEERVDVWLHALEPQLVHDEGYQLAQSEFAMATGGIGGVGLGQGQPQLIPAASTDFIFSAIGEELGLLGTTAVLLLALVLVARGLRIALQTSDGFGKLLATGLTAILALQTFIIVGGVTRLIPLTGITLPFVSYGGSSLLANFIILALLIRVSAAPRKS